MLKVAYCRLIGVAWYTLSQEACREMSAYEALAGRIEKALADVERVVARAEMLAARARA